MSKPRPEQKYTPRECRADGKDAFYTIDNLPVTPDELASLPLMTGTKDPEKFRALAETIIRARRKKLAEMDDEFWRNDSNSPELGTPFWMNYDKGTYMPKKKDPAPIFGPIAGRILWAVIYLWPYVFLFGGLLICFLMGWMTFGD